MSTFHDRADLCRAAILATSDADDTYRLRRLLARTCLALSARCDTYLPINVPTIRLEGSAGLRPNTGKQARHAAAPDPIEGSRHTVKRGRNKRGATAEVTAYGLAHVVGSWDCADDPPCRDDVSDIPVLASVLEASGSLKRGARGMSALDVYRLTQRLFGDDPEFPALLSTDNMAHHAVIHGDDSDMDDSSVAWHNPSDPFAACDMLNITVPDSRVTYPRRGYGLTFGLPSECVVDRWKVARWIASTRETSSADAGRVMARRVRVGKRPVKRPAWRAPAFKSLPMPTPRADDIPTTPRWTALHNGYGATFAVMFGHAAYRWQYVTACDQIAVRTYRPRTDRTPERITDAWRPRVRTIVATGPTDGLWLGHTHVTRPAPKNGASTDGKRARVARVKRTVDDITAASLQELLGAFGQVPIGKRAKWTCGPKSGTFTRAADGRYSVATPDGALVKSVRTVDAVRRKLEIHLAS